MSTDTIYLNTILQHYRDPRNRGTLEPCDGKARGHNPNCGDDLMVYLRTREERLSEIRFEGKGCAISLSSASMMTEAVTGKSRDEVMAIARAFRRLMQDGVATEGKGVEPAALGELAVMEGIRRYEARIKCALLAWNALEEALAGSEGDR